MEDKHISIFYDKHDSAFAHQLAGDLRQHEVPVWMASESLSAGIWHGGMARALRRSSHVLVVLSPAATESKWVELETAVTLELERRGKLELIPIMSETCEVPILLLPYHMVIFDGDYKSGLKQLLSILGVKAMEVDG